MNQGRLANPQLNEYKFESDSSVRQTDTAPALDYENGSVTAETSHGETLNATKRSNNERGQKYTYTIPPELAEAARVVAEAYPQSLPTDYGVDIAAVVAEYRPYRHNDTNVPAQKYQQPNGLDGYVHRVSIEDSLETQRTKLKKRSTTDFWLTTMGDSGSSPYAPDGYKVWRNVLDYGAKGDGITDDTAAINRAISDGGRCGADCGSSTIYPAFVYFPSGTYLVSSPIIQYYNTEFYGNSFDYPTILAASSFVGLGVITSDVYTGDDTEWYVNQNNFLRSIRNFRMDITRTDPNAYVCAIHWQVAQGTSLENIEFYMMQDGVTTQQGIYMENGSGGFLTNLTFVGGNFGAYFGNQQFTTTHIMFLNCKTAIQVHWDWAWTMQDVFINNCTNGVVIVGGAGGPKSTGQSVGSLILVDAVIANTQTGIVTTLLAENSTSFLLQGTAFLNVETAILDNSQGKTLMAGGWYRTVESWGFGRVASSSANSTFYNGQDIPSMNRSSSLTEEYSYVLPNIFIRDRPTYRDVGMSQVINVKAWGAAGDGKTDDTAVLNSILDRAANMSSIVFFPYGIYIIRDTLHVPVNSRIIGQVWSQIMATGQKFQDEQNPHVAVQVGRPGEKGIIEIQSLLFTVSGPTAGAILMEWNVRQTLQGSAGMWDSHFRVGGAIGSDLQATQCPKGLGMVMPDCVAASLLLHLTPQSSAYLSNIWLWTADHDLDLQSQDQIDVYTARGVLIESQGPTWLYGTASEHDVLYQYQVSQAKDLYMGMIQTESPYFQNIPPAPSPFSPGLFPNDPPFTDCDSDSQTCAVSLALRIIDSKSVYTLGAGLYSWFSSYSQECLNTEDCQQRAVEISQSTDTWLYNLVTRGIIEMVSPVNEKPTLSADNVNGFMSSILAWVREADATIGARKFPGFQLYQPEWLDGLTDTCKTALSQKILCHPWLQANYQGPGGGRYIENNTMADDVCDKGCGESLSSWMDNVSNSCSDQEIDDTDPTAAGGYIYAGYNLTCLQDPSTKHYCPDVLVHFTEVDSVRSMTLSEMCSYCFTTSVQMQQASRYAAYTEDDKDTLEILHEECGLSGPTDLHNPLYTTEAEEAPFCASGITHTTSEGDTCDLLAARYQVASAAIQIGNPTLVNDCSELIAGRELCMPFSCDVQYTLQDNDTCFSIFREQHLKYGDVRKYNPWLNSECTNLQTTRQVHGSVVCLSPQGGSHNATGSKSSKPKISNGYTNVITYAPDGATVANGTTCYCGKWYTVEEGDTCAAICIKQEIPSGLFLASNPSLVSDDCDSSLKVGYTYCVGPDTHWDDPDLWDEDDAC
ncbi:pectin lyase-like protein [Aspergillus homomorphus CBS 101889]|uniref:Pectin lyase-like protein n=1 Tax=Aspergillus homomorphus (strain CBS 101889) TaxID=1450537 RepID=A0A395HFF3_ASPHC|nr:pectin lyase-like protein [Aspergillus homomorphus CBS 101889]RAL06587.1 pectin lyase-like protein [Aspergillus homomorphus CBS 101889]